MENKGPWALEAPPKRAKQMNARGLFIGWQDTEVRSNALPVFELNKIRKSRNIKHTCLGFAAAATEVRSSAGTMINRSLVNI
jgi:hypothetical protein